MILMVLPEYDFDPTEAAVPWWHLRQAGHDVTFATPQGKQSYADPQLVTKGFGIWSPFLMTSPEALEIYRAMEADYAFQHPLAYDEVQPGQIDAVVIPGGHAQGVKTLLESARMQQVMVDLFARDVPVGAVCHGVVLLARSRVPQTGRSVLHGRKTTSLTNFMELSAWWMTRWWLGNYYRTYPVTVQDEVMASLAAPANYQRGPIWPRRDTAAAPQRGFVVRDGNYLSARWPGDCNLFGQAFVALLAERGIAATGSLRSARTG